MSFVNCYGNSVRAEAYSKLEFANTYWLAFRDLPDLYAKYARGSMALDFGCGTGRSTRFLNRLGFDSIGVDISPEMLVRARETDPEGDYRLIPDDDMSGLPRGSFTLIQSAFTFDNVPGRDNKIRIFRELRSLLTADGVLVNIVSAPEIYWHEWASFSSKDFPENRDMKPGNPVKIITTDFEDRTPAVDILWPDASYRDVYAEAGFHVEEMLKPLAHGDEPFRWINEEQIAPWVIYVLKIQHSTPGSQGE